MTIPIWVLLLIILHFMSCILLAFLFGVNFDRENIKFTNEFELKDKTTGNVTTYEKWRRGFIGIMLWLFLIIITWEVHFILIVAFLIASDLAEKLSLYYLSRILNNIGHKIVYPVEILY